MQNFNNFLASVHYLNHPLISLLSSLCLFLLGIFILSRNFKSKLYRSFFLVMFFKGIWFLGSALSMFYFNNFERSGFWHQFGYSGVLFIALADYNFFLAYSKKRKTILYYFLCAISLLEFIYLWFFYNVEIGGNYSLPNVGIVYSKLLSAPALFLFFGMIKYIIIILTISIFFWVEYKKEYEVTRKKRLKWLTIIFFLFSLGWIEWLVIFNIPLHIAWVLVPLLSISIVYSIFKYELLNINVIIKKTFLYSLGIALLSGAIFGVSFLNIWFTEHISGFRPWMIPVFAGIVAFIVGRLFWNKSKEVDKLKYEFITVAAHKLRTPLTEVKWAADALDEKTLSEEERKNLTSGIKSANTRLITLTDELLSIAKTEAGQYQYKLEPLDFEKMVRSVVNDFQHQIQEKRLKLTYDYDKNLPKVNLDKIRVPMVIQILLENATTYTKDKIDISIRKDKNDILFSIKDNGIGITKEDLPHIFSRFYRSHDAYLTETEGEGIGLYLAKSIIDKHNAKIGASSEGKDKGSEFWVKIKLKNAII